MIYRSMAPLRIGLAGGGTDLSPFSEQHGGAILNTTINLFANASITPRTDGKIIFNAIDRNERYEFDSAEELEVHKDKLPLQVGVYNRIIKDYVKAPLSFEMITYIDAPAGSGLGTSSTLVVAILGAFIEWQNLALGEYDVARLAYSIEREDLKMAGGKQDQYAATFGGVNFMEFSKDKVVVNPLRIKEEILRELEFHLLLFYTQTHRESAKIIEVQKANVTNSKDDVVEATLQLKKQAFMMKEALLKGELHRVGEILDFGWQNKKKLAAGITNPLIDDIYDAGKAAGASGGKISGAGGGGFMTFYAPYNKGFDVIDALTAKGIALQRYKFYKKGLTTWTSHQ